MSGRAYSRAENLESGGGLPQSKTRRKFGEFQDARSVLECASPLALFPNLQSPNRACQFQHTGLFPTSVTTLNLIYKFDITVTPDLVDGNGHVNNVVYIQWLQDAAMRHAQSTGCIAATAALGASWVVRTHHIEYLSPAFAGDRIVLMTWVADLRKVRSLRRYRFVRLADGAVLARGETDWVFVDAGGGRPRAIPGEIRKMFTVVAGEPENPRGVGVME